jgi:hypothetical protein
LVAVAQVAQVPQHHEELTDQILQPHFLLPLAVVAVEQVALKA